MKSQILQIFPGFSKNHRLSHKEQSGAEVWLCAAAALCVAEDGRACDDCLLSPTLTEHCHHSSHANTARSPVENWTHIQQTYTMSGNVGTLSQYGLYGRLMENGR